MNIFPHIISDPSILGGKPIIKGTRISVSLIMEWLGTGATPADIGAKHPMLTELIVLEAIQYAAGFLKNDILIEVKVPA